jgi:hypothetical protein
MAFYWLSYCQVALERLELPSNVVEGSDRAYLHVTGDIMAPALENVGNLVNMPTGMHKLYKLCSLYKLYRS